MDRQLIVVNLESDWPEILGQYQGHDPDANQTLYVARGERKTAPSDCVAVIPAHDPALSEAIRRHDS